MPFPPSSFNRSQFLFLPFLLIRILIFLQLGSISITHFPLISVQAFLFDPFNGSARFHSCTTTRTYKRRSSSFFDFSLRINIDHNVNGNVNNCTVRSVRVRSNQIFHFTVKPVASHLCDKKLTTADSFLSSSLSSQSPVTVNQMNCTTPPTVAASPKDRVRSKTRRKYHQRRIGTPSTEPYAQQSRQERQKAFEYLLANQRQPSLWSFESLFPQPVWDEQSIQQDLSRNETHKPRSVSITKSRQRISTSLLGDGSAILRGWRQKRIGSKCSGEDNKRINNQTRTSEIVVDDEKSISTLNTAVGFNTNGKNNTANININTTSVKVDADLTRLVEDRVNGYRRTPLGDIRYDYSLLPKGRAVQFREGVRLGNPLKVNADILNALAKKELQRCDTDEAIALYQQAVTIDPRDGRAYLGLARCAARRRDYALQREWLTQGLKNSVSLDYNYTTNDCDDINGAYKFQNSEPSPDRGPNPFLLQALGVFEEKTFGNYPAAEQLYIAATRSRPSHAAAWVALGQLRTRRLGQAANVGRRCFVSAEKELQKAGKPPSSFVYTAWADLEWHMEKNINQARELFQKALAIDPRCSAAWLQLGVLETEEQNWTAAEHCFETVLQFDGRNSRVLQAYALMKAKRGDSRRAIGLFERALQANPRDAGVLQPYALYVAQLGDINAARELLRRGTVVNKRHAPVWQAWGVLESRHGTAADARWIFQQGIWNCGQLSGRQSGGYHCARLWQAWGVLEAQEGEHSAARRCFSRSLDAHALCVPAYTAWAYMEAELGNVQDARMIMERALVKFSDGCDDKILLWRAYERMEQRLIGDLEAAKIVDQRASRESYALSDTGSMSLLKKLEKKECTDVTNVRPTENEFNDIARFTSSKATNRLESEAFRWEKAGSDVSILMNDNAIEARMPVSVNKRHQRQKEKEEKK